MEKPNLSLEIFNALKTRIMNWEYFPGQRLTEESLCEEFGVSRIPVREALRMLEDSNLIDKVPHRGCTVKQPDLAQINQLYDVRLALELFVVDQLTRQGVPEAIWQQLHQTWDDLLQQEDSDKVDSTQLARLDETFHETLSRATGNEVLLDLLHGINERLYFVRSTDITTINLLKITCQQHLHILDSIQSGDVELARDAIRTNIDFGRNNVEIALKNALIRAFTTQHAEHLPLS